MLDDDLIVGVVGAGAMGTGIAQVAAAAGHRVVVADSLAGAAHRAKVNITKAMDRDVEKGRSSRDQADALLSRIDFRDAPLAESACRGGLFKMLPPAGGGV